MSFVGAGVGAGILFLPIQAGISGLWCFIVSAGIAFILSCFSHKVYAKLILDSNSATDYPHIVKEHLGKTYSVIITALFFHSYSQLSGCLYYWIKCRNRLFPP